MDGGEIIASVLERQGVRQLYTLCGGHISPILVASKRLGIDVIDVRDEKHAVFAADATARMTGIPGVAAVTATPTPTTRRMSTTTITITTTITSPPRSARAAPRSSPPVS